MPARAVPTAAPSQAPSAAPAAAPQRKIKTIFDYQKQIGLTDAQTSQMKAAVKDLQTTMLADRKKLVPAIQQLRQLVRNGAPLEQIRSQYIAIYTIQADLKVADLAASRRINGIMNPDQLAKWHKIQQASRGGNG